MEIIREKARNISIEKRVRILGNHFLSTAKIGDIMLKRAQRENVSDQRVLKLLRYLLSFECFQELESYHFWFYDPKDLVIWNEILDHIYKRSITPNYIIN